jgi:hypothetical protein
MSTLGQPDHPWPPTLFFFSHQFRREGELGGSYVEKKRLGLRLPQQHVKYNIPSVMTCAGRLCCILVFETDLETVVSLHDGG